MEIDAVGDRGKQGTARLDGLQAGRALAATMVAAFHANIYVLPDKLYNGGSAGAVFNLGYSGVEFFFVLSGFIMVLVHERDFNRPQRVWQFLAKRFWRIYPIYWAILIAVVVAAIATGLGSESLRSPAVLVGSALLLPMRESPAIEVAWSLTHEMLFYSILALLIVNRTIGWAVIALWMAGCVAMIWSGPFAFPLNVLFSAYNLLFPLGMFAAYRFSRKTRPQALVALACGMVLFFGVGLGDVLGGIHWTTSLRTVLYGIGAMLMITGLAAGALRIPQVLVLLGDASYVTYLTHVPVMAVLARAAHALGLQVLPPLAMLALLVAGALVAGVILHLTLERAVLRTATRILQRREAN
jgi:exopolysaccharide production protein ExoZ